MTSARIGSFCAKWSAARTLSASILGLAAMQPAWAHHPMGGATPETFMEGLLSGLAHPVIGLDHLVFLIGAGVLMGLVSSTRRTLAGLALTFVAAGTTGTLLRSGGLPPMGGELAVAVSLLVLGAGLWRQYLPATAARLVLAALGGAAHGYAFGEAVIGAESTPLGAYLAGLAAVQFGLLAVTFAGTRRAAGAVPPPSLRRAVQALSAGTTALGGWALVIHLWN